MEQNMRKSRYRGSCPKGALQDATNDVLNTPKIQIMGCPNKNNISPVDGPKRNSLLGFKSTRDKKHRKKIFPPINRSFLHVNYDESTNLSPYRQNMRKFSSSKSKKSQSSKKDTSKRKKNPKEKLKPINSQNNLSTHNKAVKYQIQQQRKKMSNVDSTQSINPRQILSPHAYSKKFRKSSCNWNRGKCPVSEKQASQNDLFSRFQPQQPDGAVGQEQNPQDRFSKAQLKENENMFQAPNEEVASLKSMIQQLRVKNSKLESELQKERSTKKDINSAVKRRLQEDEKYRIPQV